MKTTEKNDSQDLGLELLRIISVFFVIFNHTNQNGYVLYTTFPPGSFQYILYFPISVFCKFSVPVFFMISGILLLGKEEPLGVIFKKRLRRLLILLPVISVIYYFAKIADMYIGLGDASVYDFFFRFFSCTISRHLWYLYAYIIFLLILPFLRILVKNMNMKQFIYYIAIAAGAMILVPLVEKLIFKGITIEVNLTIPTFEVLVFPVLGYFISRYTDLSRLTVRGLAVMWGIDLLLIAIVCILSCIENKDAVFIPEKQAEDFHYMFSMFNAVTVFATVKCLYKQGKKPLADKIISFLGGLSFGIYLFHVIFLDDIIMRLLERDMSRLLPLPLTSELIFCLIVFVISAAATYVLKKIPGIKRFL